MDQAYEMAVDALGFAITERKKEHESIPAPSQPCDLTIEDGDMCVVIEFDMRAYQKRTNSKAVKKTLSIPQWLNEEATEMGVNFSQVLQEALIQKINAK